MLISLYLLFAQVPFRLLKGEAASELASFCKRHEVAAVVCDFSPIRESRACKDGLVEQAPDLPVYEVDAHNIVSFATGPSANPVLRYAQPSVPALIP
jgi:hypothetical protein